jgi:hypothetical protein
MSQQSAAVLEQLLRGNDLGWTIDMAASKDKALSSLLESLDKAATEYRRRIGVEISFAAPALRDEAERNPHTIRAFLQSLLTTHSQEMLVMVWRILQGLSIRELGMNYREEETFNLRVALARPGAGPDELEWYRSDDINDAGLLRHFGISTINGKPFFDGFFPLR